MFKLEIEQVYISELNLGIKVWCKRKLKVKAQGN